MKMSKNRNNCREVKEITLILNIKKRKYSQSKVYAKKLVHIPHFNKKEVENWNK